MPCDLCGSDGKLYLAEIEGTRLNVCKKCSSFGEIIKKQKPKIKQQKPKIPDIEEPMEVVIENYPELIKKNRETMELKQKELARKIAEKESVIHKLESGSIEPNLELAKKLEKALNINLIQKEKIEKISKKTKNESAAVTIGDLLKKNS